MKKVMLTLPVGALLFLLPACNSSDTSTDAIGEQAEAVRLQDPIDLSLQDLLNKPRAELAELAEECATRIQIQERARREGRLEFALLPGLRLPAATPVCRRPKYSSKLGFSLPDYHAEETKDDVLAKHYASYGDVEAARRLLDPQDTVAPKEIETSGQERSYPLEWTRVVALLLHDAQLRLAGGDVDGAKTIVGMHRQLRDLLAGKAADGPLGASLLPRGRTTLAQAAAAWRAEKKTDLADQADAMLADWGGTTHSVGALRLGLPRSEVSRILRSPSHGRVVPALSTLRALDLLGLPFPDDGAEAVLAWFDQADHLSDLLICYKVGLSESFPEPGHVACLFEDQGVTSKENTKETGVRRRTYQIGGGRAEVTIVPHGAGAGGFVHLTNEKASPSISLSRDFGAFHLDRSFEQNRIGLAPEQRGTALSVKPSKFLAEIRNPLPILKPHAATIRGEPSRDVAASLMLRYDMDVAGPPAVYRLLAPLGADAGLPKFEGVSDENGGHLAVHWEDARTRLELRLPYENGRPVEFEVSDRQGREHLADRSAAAVAFDRRERKARFEAGKPRQRIDRRVEQVELGMQLQQVLQLLPSNQTSLRREIPSGLMTTFTGDPGPEDAYAVRQIFVRFDGSGHAIEVRARYADGPAAQGNTKWKAEFLNGLKKESGAPMEGPAPWASLWTDLRPQKPEPLFCRWQDDRTLLIYQRDSASLELMVRDCPLEHENGSPLPPLEYLARGPVPYLLGAKREQLLRDLQISSPTSTEDGALVLPAPAGSPHDAALIWFEKDEAVRIVIRHSLGELKQGGADQWSRELSAAWGRDLRTLGWPRRQDITAHGVLQGLSWHDERTRVRMFWQETGQGGIRLFTEWRDVPSPDQR